MAIPDRIDSRADVLDKTGFAVCQSCFIPLILSEKVNSVKK